MTSLLVWIALAFGGALGLCPAGSSTWQCAASLPAASRSALSTATRSLFNTVSSNALNTALPNAFNTGTSNALARRAISQRAPLGIPFEKNTTPTMESHKKKPENRYSLQCLAVAWSMSSDPSSSDSSSLHQ